MRILIGVDWSDQAFAAVSQTFQLYRPADVTLVHGVDLGILQHPFMAQAGNVQGYDEFRHAMVDAGHQLLERAAAMIPAAVGSIRKINEIENPAQLILDCADRLSADLVVVGVCGRNRLSEVVLGSVAHRVLLHSTRPVLVVRGARQKPKRVLVAIEHRDDADRITTWLTQYPFADSVELCLLHAVVPMETNELYADLGSENWWELAECYANDLVTSLADKLANPRYSVSTKVATGNPAAVIEQESKSMDLVIMTSHGRKGLSRFLLGSVSHAVTHYAACPVLILR